MQSLRVFESRVEIASYGLITNTNQTKPLAAPRWRPRSTHVRIDRVERYDRRPPSLKPVAEGQHNGNSRCRTPQVIP